MRLNRYSDHVRAVHVCRRHALAPREPAKMERCAKFGGQDGFESGKLITISPGDELRI